MGVLGIGDSPSRRWDVAGRWASSPRGALQQEVGGLLLSRPGRKLPPCFGGSSRELPEVTHPGCGSACRSFCHYFSLSSTLEAGDKPAGQE